MLLKAESEVAGVATIVAASALALKDVHPVAHVMRVPVKRVAGSMPGDMQKKARPKRPG